MNRAAFQASEYTGAGTFQTASYEYQKSMSGDWTVLRNGSLHLELGRGYELLPTSSCGVCSTDLARRYLPYPLPQIIGHEVTAVRDGRLVVVEINSSHQARGLESACPFCHGGMDTQCPDRITLGIDRLPGGFAPFILAPAHAVIEVPAGIPEAVAGLTEPFAAALHALDVTSVADGPRIAVLGPRRLGALLIAALDAHRRSNGMRYKITALSRHPEHGLLLRSLGADDVINVTQSQPEPNSYDVVFDTTGSPEGFRLALLLARDTVHLKSTHGQAVLGMGHLTDMVVEEIALLPFVRPSADFQWLTDRTQTNRSVYATDAMGARAAEIFGGPREDTDGAKADPAKAARHVELNRLDGSDYGRYDLALVSSLAEADTVIRPEPGKEFSLVRPRGAVIVDAEKERADSALAEALASGKKIHTSRCGDFRRALKLLSENPPVVKALEQMITHVFPLEKIADAFETAASGRSIKVLVNTKEGRHD
ncbi:MAG: alcohol dehydrogenase catalytic domain-containing protein [Spirochaetia bacterium]|nr:alcohol dehydrogenase catalytic domain-containing protein [Spirochaetia bacterium]